MSATDTDTVGPGPHLSISAPTSATGGNAFSFTVTALNPNDRVDSTFGGAVVFVSSDAAASLLPSSTLTGGRGTFTATLHTGGYQTLSAISSSAVTGSVTIEVESPHFR